MTNFYKEAIKRGFSTGREYYLWLLENKKIKYQAEVDNDMARKVGFKNQTEYRKSCANKRGFKNDIERQENWVRNKGYKDINEYNREKRWNRGYQSPMSENENCSAHLGIYIGERNIVKVILLMIFEIVEEMNYGNSDFDFICRCPREEFIKRYPIFRLSRNGEYRINAKCRRLSINIYNYNKWNFPIRYNDTTDYFILVGFDIIGDKLDLSHIWLFKKDEIIRGRIFHEFSGFGITNDKQRLLQIQRYELKYELEKVKIMWNQLLETIK